MDYSSILSKELEIKEPYAKAVIGLIDEGNTIPFIARYRKEATGSMDDQILREFAERLDYLRGLSKRKEEVSSTIEEQGKLTPELVAQLDKAQTLAAVEDIYRPYKQKRKTRASMAIAKGLEPLADVLLEQNMGDDIQQLAANFIDVKNEVEDAEQALAGARDILAERFSEDIALRNALRVFYADTALIQSKASTEEDSVYSGYYAYEQPVKKTVGHRILALDRGEKDGFLKVSVVVDTQRAVSILQRKVVKNNSQAGEQVALAAADGYSRLLHPSLEREVRSALTENADEKAINVFGQNLRQLLLQPPIRGKVTIGLDPGYRMGCKVAVVDEIGRVLATDVIFPLPGFYKEKEAAQTLTQLIKKYDANIIAIGNGTAGRETEIFVVEVLKDINIDRINDKVQYMVVNEAGASVYSASKLAAEEFPEYDVNVRSAISIARRLQDPLAELVKIDPKAVGVGQYQHDMPPARLAAELDGVVEDCVNTVGVELNTASVSLLQHVAGLSKSIATNIVQWRDEEGSFKNRKQLLKIKKLGPKAFLQCAGFLRIEDGVNALDKTAVHPESYKAATQLLQICGFSVEDIGTSDIAELTEQVNFIGKQQLAEQLDIGVPTLEDIVEELLRPGRDIRDSLPAPMLRQDILEMKDLKSGMEIIGTVRNVVDFGAFVDIGVHQDGLVHISEISDKFIKHPAEVLAVGDVVTVWVLGVDEAKKRISLTMKNNIF